MLRAPGKPLFEQLMRSVMPAIKEIQPKEAYTAVKDGAKSLAKLIDVREDSEWRRARPAIPSVVHLPRGILERDIEGVATDPNQPIVLYCAGGIRSALAAESLQRMGYKNVKSMAGGFAAWANQGLPVDSTPK